MVRRARRLLARVQAFVSTRKDDIDFEEELAAHLDLLTEENMRRGLTPAEARRAARITLGSVASLKEQHRDMRALPGVTAVLADIVFATRLFRREPALFALTIAGLALAIGISTSIFSMVNVVAFRGDGVTASSDVVQLIPLNGGRPGSPWLHGDYAQLQSTLSGAHLTASIRPGIVAFPFGTAEDGLPFEYPETTAVTGNYFTLLGGRAVLGRTLIESDDVAGAARVVAMSELFWKTRFGSDPAIVGRTVHLGGVPFTVTGVIERAFTGPRDAPTAPAFWMPATTFFEVRESDATAAFNRARTYYNVYARLGPQMPAAAVAARATSIAVARAAAFVPPGNPSNVGVRLAKLGERLDGNVGRFITAVVLIVLGLVLLEGSRTSPMCCWPMRRVDERRWERVSRSAPAAVESSVSC